MNIGIVIAITRELKTFLESSFKSKIIKDGVREIYSFKVKKNNVFVIQSGAGIVDASSATQYLITKNKCEIILNFGVTGCLDKSLKVGQLFVVEKVCHYDVDSSGYEPVKKYQYIEFKDQYIPMDKKLISYAKKINKNLVSVICASGSKFIDDIKDKALLCKETGGSICDMEIAGIARTCFKNNVRCFSIKCISDDFYGDGKDFDKNVFEASEKAFALLKEILVSL